MAEETPGPKMHVVPRLQRVGFKPENLQKPASGPQASLFPEPRAGMVIFVSFPEVDDTEFIEVLRAAKPSLVVELRYSPRFDIGKLNRRAVFEFFEREQCRYLDLASSRMADRDAFSLLEDVRMLFEKEPVGLDRPVAFLTSSRIEPEGLQDQIIEVVSAATKGKAQVLRVPQYVTA